MGTAGTGVIDTLTFNLIPLSPATPTAPSNRNNVTVSWNGGVPTFASTATTHTSRSRLAMQASHLESHRYNTIYQWSE